MPTTHLTTSLSQSSHTPPDLHSFPTRRSSDLLNKPAAGKTGTINSNMAVWFNGYTPALSTASMIAGANQQGQDRKSTRLNSSHLVISYAVFCLKKKKKVNRTEAHESTMSKRKQ